MTELLFEIFCEEIPARMQARAGADLSKALTDGLKKAGLSVEGAQVFTGPRRLVFTADVPARSPDISEERKGPRVGSPEQALAGFLRGAGLTDISQAQTRSDPKKGEYYVAVIEKAGEDTADILSALIPNVMTNFPWPKSMKSGSTSFRWVRPLQSMICLLGGAVVPVQVGGVTAGNTTEGHRRHGKGPYAVKGFADYQKTLEVKGHVILSADARKELIITDARKACAAKGLELVEDEGLLNEVSGLAEWPVVILGDMDPSFLELPAEVIRLSMRTHQKYFAVRDPKTGGLAPNFIVVANQAAPDGGAEIAKGNSKVLSARLADAQFFQSEDAKKKLEDYYEKLGTVVFHKKLGSIKDKAERVAALAKELAPKVGADAAKAEQAAKLAKCDLVTNMVVEFTSLQGQIGAQMYLNEGGAADIADAIEQHYKPQGPSDSVPTNPVAVAVALADKLDTLVSFWAIDEKPTGSKDPFALRRAALGVVRIILENDVRLDLITYLRKSGFELRKNFLFNKVLSKHELGKHLFPYKNLMKPTDAAVTTEGLLNLNLNGGKLILPSEDRDVFADVNVMARAFSEIVYDLPLDEGIMLAEAAVEPYFHHDEEVGIRVRAPLNEFYNAIDVIAGFSIEADLLAFVTDRLTVYLRDKGIRHDIIDAAFASGGDDLVSIVNRVNALQGFLESDEGTNLLAGYKRAANILKAEAKKGKLPEGAPEAPSQKESLALYKALEGAGPKIEKALKSEDYTAAMTELATLRAPIDAFFTDVQVISDDTAVKENNLRLLIQIRDTARHIADLDAVSAS